MRNDQLATANMAYASKMNKACRELSGEPLCRAVGKANKELRDATRINEAFIGWLGDQATVSIYNDAYKRYRDVCAKYGDDSWMAFPAFIDHVAALSYVKYDNDTGDVHFLLKKVAA